MESHAGLWAAVLPLRQGLAVHRPEPGPVPAQGARPRRSRSWNASGYKIFEIFRINEVGKKHLLFFIAQVRKRHLAIAAATEYRAGHKLGDALKNLSFGTHFYYFNFLTSSFTLSLQSGPDAE